MATPDAGRMMIVFNAGPPEVLDSMSRNLWGRLCAPTRPVPDGVPVRVLWCGPEGPHQRIHHPSATPVRGCRQACSYSRVVRPRDGSTRPSELRRRCRPQRPPDVEIRGQLASHQRRSPPPLVGCRLVDPDRRTRHRPPRDLTRQRHVWAGSTWSLPSEPTCGLTAEPSAHVGDRAESRLGGHGRQTTSKTRQLRRRRPFAHDAPGRIRHPALPRRVRRHPHGRGGSGGAPHQPGRRLRRGAAMEGHPIGGTPGRPDRASAPRSTDCP